MAAVAIPPASKALEAVAKGLTGDFVVIEGRIFRRIETKERVPTGALTPTGRPAMTTVTHVDLEPINVEAHVNPISLGILGIGLAVVGATAYVAWEGLTLGTPLGAFRVIEGLKDSEFWKTEASRARAALTIRRLRKGAMSGEGTIPDPDLFDNDPCVVSEAVFKAETNRVFRAAMKAKAKKAGCDWAQ